MEALQKLAKDVVCWQDNTVCEGNASSEKINKSRTAISSLSEFISSKEFQFLYRFSVGKCLQARSTSFLVDSLGTTLCNSAKSLTKILIQHLFLNHILTFLCHSMRIQFLSSQQRLYLFWTTFTFTFTYKGYYCIWLHFVSVCISSNNLQISEILLRSLNTNCKKEIANFL